MSAVSPAPAPFPVTLRRLGRADYVEVERAMRELTDTRGPGTRDELWLVEHPAVYTLGLNGRGEHLRDPGDIPVVRTDRGGQVTYHGPGQVVLYALLDLRRLGLGVRALVDRLEQAVIDLLAQHGIAAVSRPEAPGVYVGGRKIAALGLRVRRGCSYHGLALNVDMDLSPFGRIDPCGYPGLAVTRLADLGIGLDWREAAEALAGAFLARLGAVAVEARTE